MNLIAMIYTNDKVEEIMFALKYYKFIDNFYFKSVNYAEHCWFEVYTQVSTLSSLRVKHVFSISYNTIIFSMNSKGFNSEL